MSPQLRNDVQIIRTSPKSFVVMDPRSGGSFVCSPADQQLLSLLDGRRDPHDIRQEYARKFGRELSERHLEEFLNQLHANGLLGVSAGEDLLGPAAKAEPRLVSPASRHADGRRSEERVNRFFDALVLLFGWILHPLWMIPLFILLIVGIAALVHGIDRYWRELSTLFLGIPTLLLIPLSLAQTLVFMNLPREAVVGMASRRFGVWVRRFGIVWVNDTLPFFACDRGDSSGVLTRRGKRTLLLAGWWSQMAIGSLSAIGWSMAVPGSGPGIFCLLLILPWVVGIFLHFNVLTRLDGYKLLCVLTRQPQLQERALAETAAWLRWRRSPEPLTRPERFWFRVYGLCWHAWMWFLRVLYIVGGIYWLILRMEGLGALIGLSCLILWYRKPMRRILMERTGTEWMFRKSGSAWVRWTLRLVFLAALVIVGLLPYDRTVTGECRLIPLVEMGVRAQLTDEIVKIHVEEGQWIEAGAVIATLSGRDVEREYEQRVGEQKEAQAQYDLLLAGPLPEDLAMAEQEVQLWKIRLDFAESELVRLKKLEQEGASDPDELREGVKERDSSEQLYMTSQEKLARVKEGARAEEKQAAAARVEVAKARLAQADQKRPLLTIRSPIAGRIITPAIKQREGQVAIAGDLIATVQDSSRLQVEIAADESAAAVKAGFPVVVRLNGLDGEPLSGKVDRVATATSSANEFRVEKFRSDREAMIEEGRELETDEYHVRVYAVLDATEVPLIAGMSGHARIILGPDRVWSAFARPIVRYFRTEVWSWLP